MSNDMMKLKNMFFEIGLVVEKASNNQLKGNSCNVRSWHTFRAWINKSGNLTIRTRGIQKSFSDWTNKNNFKQTLLKFELL